MLKPVSCLSFLADLSTPGPRGNAALRGLRNRELNSEEAGETVTRLLGALFVERGDRPALRLQSGITLLCPVGGPVGTRGPVSPRLP